MGLIDYFKSVLKGGGRYGADGMLHRYQMFQAYQPVFRTRSGEIYESQLVRQSLHAHARHAMKLKPVFQGSTAERLGRQLETGPNEYQSWPDFLERCENIYQAQNNLFISPLLDEFGQIAGYWPLFPTESEVREREGIAYLLFTFANGKKMATELRRIGHLKKHQLKDDFFGADNSPLDYTLDMDAMTAQGIIEGIKNSSGYQFMAELTQKMFAKDVKKQREEFDELNFGTSGGRGLLLFNGNLKNVRQIEPGKLPIDEKQMKLIEDHVMQYFGTNPDILMNTGDTTKLEAFYDGETEPFAIKLSDAMTRMSFDQGQIHRGNRILFAGNRLQYMSTADKINMTKELGDRGAILIDEVRELFNYPPLPDGKGQHAPIRGEYYMADEGKKGGDEKGDAGKKQEGKKDA